MKVRAPPAASLCLFLIVAICSCADDKVPGCAPSLERTALVRAVREAMEARGLKPNLDRDHARIEIGRRACDYVVNVVSLPPTPGGATVIIFDQRGSVLQYIEGH